MRFSDFINIIPTFRLEADNDLLKIEIFMIKALNILHFCSLNLYVMSNNDILKKLRVALKLTTEDIQKILLLADFRISSSELNALFRNDDHPKFKACGDQILRNFLNGLIIEKRGSKEDRVKENNLKQDTHINRS